MYDKLLPNYMFIGWETLTTMNELSMKSASNVRDVSFRVLHLDYYWTVVGLQIHI